MDEALAQAANMPVGNDSPAETPAEVESAPTETNTPELTETGENQPNTQETQEKMVPLTALQREREEKKQLREYIKSLQQAPVPQVEEPVFQPQGFQPQFQEEVEYVDPSQFVTIEQYNRMQKDAEDRARAKAEFGDYFKEMPELEDMAEGLRQRKALNEYKYLSYYDAVKKAIEPYKMAQARGQRSAQESIEIQKQARVEGTGVRVDDKAERLSQLKNNLSKRGSASTDALTEILKQF